MMMRELKNGGKVKVFSCDVAVPNNMTADSLITHLLSLPRLEINLVN